MDEYQIRKFNEKADRIQFKKKLINWSNVSINYIHHGDWVKYTYFDKFEGIRKCVFGKIGLNEKIGDTISYINFYVKNKIGRRYSWKINVLKHAKIKQFVFYKYYPN